jgi:hypothetical protein
MPDLLGPNPCLACEVFGGPCCCDPEAWADTKGDACGPYAAYKAKRTLLEALKAGGVKTNIYPVPVTRKEDSAVLPPFEGLVFAHMPTEGWLIFIPEAQE